MNPQSHPRATLGGFGAIVLWSTTIAFSRPLTEDLGIFLGPGLVFLIGGAAGYLVARLRGGRGLALGQLSPTYLLACGGCFVAYQLLLYSAVGLAAGRLQVLGVAMGNYLWPALTLVFSVAFFGRRARWGLWPGMALALAGVALAKVSSAAGGGGAVGAAAAQASAAVQAGVGALAGNEASASVAAQVGAGALSDGVGVLAGAGALTGAGPQAAAAPLASEPGLLAGLLALGLAVGAAVTWALYSNLSRRFAGQTRGDAVPLFLLASAAVFLPVGLVSSGPHHWTPATGAIVVYMGLFATLLAYRLWDGAVRHGNIVLVATVSYLIPLLSSLVIAVVLGVRPRPLFWGACALTIAGAWVCSRSVREGPAREDNSSRP